MKLGSYVCDGWVEGAADGRPLVDPASGEVLAHADATGLNAAAAMAHARRVGGPALRALGFAERGALLKAVADVLTVNRDKYGEIARRNSGNTPADAAVDIDGAIGTLKVFARLGKTLGDARVILEPGQDQLAKDPVFFARHLHTSRPGVALQINAFNFPSWGLWEKVAVATLAGVPSLAKPATATAWLSHEMVRDVAAAGVLPPGALSLVCGGGEVLLEALQPTDSVAFTGSADTGQRIRAHPRVLAAGPRVTIEADSINATILGPDAGPGTPVFDLAVREIVKALSVKAGQLCTNIRRVFVPAGAFDALTEAVAAKAGGLVVGDPADEATRVGPLVNKAQQADALAKIADLSREAALVTGGGVPSGLDSGSFLNPTLFSCHDPAGATAVHETEVFGPCVTVMPYADLDSASALAIRGGGALALSLFSNDPDMATGLIGQLGPWHGRVLVVDEEVGKAHTGHAIVMPQCVHGGPGRAGGGEELGGLRGLRFHMQRTAVQAGPGLLAALAQDAVEASL